MVRVLYAVLICIIGAHEGAAQVFKACSAEGGPVQANGVLYCSAAPELPLTTIAERAAPVLWFSPDEPLLDGRVPGNRTPASLPFDPPATGPIVYYDFYAVYRSGVEDPYVDHDRTIVDLRRVSSVVVDYVLYYPYDFGLGAHRHDLEYVRTSLRVERSNCGYAVRLTRVEGAAHGSEWYHNILDLTLEDNVDASFPITILVEEGKHASSPDRNGDGHYTPRYDVNRRVNEAWGIRDTLRSGEIATAKYDAASTKPRNAAQRIGLKTETEPDECLYANYRPRGPDGGPLPPSVRYELRPTPHHSRCVAEQDGPFNLCETMKARELGQAPSTGPLRTDRLFRFLYRIPNTGLFDAFSAGYRRDGATDALTVTYPVFSLEVPRVGGWVLPKVSLFNLEWCGWTCNEWIDRTIDVLYLPSVSRWVDWYGAIGRAMLRNEPDRTEMELGVRFRFMLKGTFVGFQVGTRWSGFKEIRHQRMVVESGIGVW